MVKEVKGVRMHQKLHAPTYMLLLRLQIQDNWYYRESTVSSGPSPSPGVSPNAISDWNPDPDSDPMHGAFSGIAVIRMRSGLEFGSGSESGSPYPSTNPTAGRRPGPDPTRGPSCVHSIRNRIRIWTLLVFSVVTLACPSTFLTCFHSPKPPPHTWHVIPVAAGAALGQNVWGGLAPRLPSLPRSSSLSFPLLPCTPHKYASLNTARGPGGAM